MEEIKIDFKSADELLHYLLEKSLREKIIFRGISKNNQLYPSIMRVFDGESSQDLSKYENDVLKKFIKRGSLLLSGNISPIDFVGTAQHFGLPTRLIDWTKNPFIALFFAINSRLVNNEYQLLMIEEKELIILNNTYVSLTMGDMFAIASLTPIHYYKRFVEALEKGELVELLDAIKTGYCAENDISETDFNTNIRAEIESKINDNKFIAIIPNNSNARLNAQQGLFIVPNKLNSFDINNQYESSKVKIISINPALKNELIELLEKMGYSKSKLFFDMQNICESIKYEILDLMN